MELTSLNVFHNMFHDPYTVVEESLKGLLRALVSCKHNKSRGVRIETVNGVYLGKQARKLGQESFRDLDTRLFVADDHIGTVKFTTNLTHCDWNERDSTFSYCKEGECLSYEMPESNPLTTEREVAVWIWICSYGIPGAVIAVLTIFMCIPKKGSREYVTVRYMNSFTQNSMSYYT